jgi:hypothetical protein
VSNAQIIAATTAALRQLLVNEIPARDSAIPSVNVSTVPPDRVNADFSTPQLNLFLYQTLVNGSWINRDAAQTQPSASRWPPLALNLRYLITAYGPVDLQGGDFGHRVLGAAVSALHDHPILGRDELVQALTQGQARPQVERVRVTPISLSTEEMSKLWTTFQTNYRVSTAYEAAVVLIESDRPQVSPLPVLRRGGKDRGAFAVASPAPTLLGSEAPNSQPSVRLGERLALLGSGLDADAISVRIAGRALTQPVSLTPEPGRTEDRLEVSLPGATSPGAMTTWAPGFFTVTIVSAPPDLPAWTSNAVPFALAPIVTVTPNTAPAGTVTLTITMSPRPRLDQEILLLFGDQQVQVKTRTDPANTTDPTTFTFDVTGQAGTSMICRLRVDGVESLPIVTADGVLGFDPTQTVKFT